MKSAGDAVRFPGIGEVVALVGAGQPHPCFLAVVEHDLLGQAEAEALLKNSRLALMSTARQLK